MDPIFWVLLVVLVPFLAFALIYGMKSPWRESAAGRSVMFLAASIVLILAQALFNTGVPDYPGKDEIRFAFLLLVSGAGWYLLFTMVKLQWGGRRVLDNVPTDAESQAIAEVGVDHYDHSAARRRRRDLRRLSSEAASPQVGSEE